MIASQARPLALELAPSGLWVRAVLVAAALGPRFGPASVALYVVEGLIGLPVFAGGTSGPARIARPTGG